MNPGCHCNELSAPTWQRPKKSKTAKTQARRKGIMVTVISIPPTPSLFTSAVLQNGVKCSD